MLLFRNEKRQHELHHSRVNEFDESFLSKERISSLVMFVAVDEIAGSILVRRIKFNHSFQFEYPELTQFSLRPLMNIRFINRKNILKSGVVTPFYQQLSFKIK